MQQKLDNVRVRNLCSANGMLAELLKLPCTVLFKAPNKPLVDAFIASFTDAAFNTSASKTYGQNGFVTGIAFRQEGSEENSFHVCDWNSSKQKRVCNSSFGAEILAAADADDRTFALRESIRSLFGPTSSPGIRSHLYTDSMGLFDTISTLHDGREYRLRQTVQRIRDSFEAGDLDALLWIPGVDNVADALTKRSVELQRKLGEMCSRGTFPTISMKRQLDSRSWA